MAIAVPQRRIRITDPVLGWALGAILSPAAAVTGWQLGKALWFAVILG